MRPKELPRLRLDALRREHKQHAVKINDKTTIMVNMNIPDEEARANYLLKLEAKDRKPDNRLEATKWGL